MENGELGEQTQDKKGEEKGGAVSVWKKNKILKGIIGAMKAMFADLVDLPIRLS